MSVREDLASLVRGQSVELSALEHRIIAETHVVYT